MLEYEAEVLINSDPAQVFPHLTDSESIPRWASDVIEVRQTTPGPVGVGTKMKERVNAPFGEAWVDWEVLEYMPTEKCAFASDSPLAQGKVTYELEATKQGTLLRVHIVGHGRGLLRLLEPILQRRSLAQRREDLSALKQLIEREENGQQV